MADLSLLDLILMANLFLSMSYTYSSRILFLFGFLVYCTQLIHVRILISSLYLCRSPVGVTEPMLIQRYINTYWYLYLSQISRRSLQNLYLYHGVYTCSKVPVGITEITERILVLRNLFLFGSTRKYYLFKCPKRRTLVLISNLSYTHTGVPVGTTEFILVLRIFYLYYRVYSGISDLILVLRSIYMYFGFYTCITELIHVFQILHVYYGTYTGLTELIFMYRTYSCLTDLILVLQN